LETFQRNVSTVSFIEEKIMNHTRCIVNALIAFTVGSCSMVLPTAAPQATQAKATQAAAPTSAAQGNWNAVIGITSPGVATIGKTRMTSSSKFEAQWNLPSQAVDHFEIIASEGKSKVTVNAKGAEKMTTLATLKSSAQYSVTMKACLDAKCEKFLTSDKSHLDDYAIFIPTKDLDFQVMYSNMSLSDIRPGTNFAPPFIGVVLLMNP